MRTFKRVAFVVIVLMSLIVLQTIQSGFIMYKVATEYGVMDRIESIRSEEGYVEFDSISQTFLDAVVSIEDRRFYKHDGVDFIAISRAFLSNIRSGEIVSGGSTITQQLAKNLFLSFEKKYDRKVAEVFIAWDIEEILSKEEILELYVNVINYGDGCFGIQSASEHYFEKLPVELSKAEAIILAGIPQSPGRFNLTYNMDNAVERSHQVIRAMLSEQALSISESIDVIYEIRGME